MNLFDFIDEHEQNSPLASRLRPKNIEDIVGQEHILGEGKLLRRLIEEDKLSSLILYGPSGTGKTTIASVIANTTKARFISINATTSGKKEMESAIDEAREHRRTYSKNTILFIDEIHRFNKAQQDYLLPFIEDGLVLLIGATTQNPYFEVNRALLSRLAVYELKPLSEKDMLRIIDRAMSDNINGLGAFNTKINDDAANLLARRSGGDARYVLNALELATMTSNRNGEQLVIDKELILECLGKKPIGYDKNADSHYDLASAFIKSMRGSDPNATVYYLAGMIEGGEDVRFIARRIMICASEDVGNADPMALVLATSAAEAADRVGLPEARIILSQAAIYIAMAPKSNSSYKAINSAIALVNSGNYNIPAYLKSTGYKAITDDESAGDYKYAHDYEGHYVEQQYLPDEIKDTVFYEPTVNTIEEDRHNKLNELKQKNKKALGGFDRG